MERESDESLLKKTTTERLASRRAGGASREGLRVLVGKYGSRASGGSQDD